MKTFMVILIFFVSGIWIGYYYRNADVKEEIRKKLQEQERQESERRKKSERLWETINGDSDAWKEKWEVYVIEEIINEGYPV